jgi:hypothetical protein
MPEGIPQNPQVDHLALQVIRLGVQLIPRDVGPAILSKHAGDLGKREACRLSEFDQR